MVGACAERDHRPAAGLLGIRRELARDSCHRLGRHRGDLLLPRRGVEARRIVVAGSPLTGKAVAADAVLRQQQVVDGRDETVADTPDGHAATDDRALLAAGVADVEARQVDGHGLAAIGVEREHRLDAVELEVPLAHAGLVVAVPDRAVRDHRIVGAAVDEGGLPLARLLVDAEVGGIDEPVRYPGVLALTQRDEEGQVGEASGVVDEHRHLPVDVELFEHHVTHGHRQRAVGARLRRHPLVGELRVVGVVGTDRDDLLTLVAGLGHEVRVGCARRGDVGAPHDEVARVPPVGRLGHIGLVAPDLRRGDRQVGVPVVERQHRAAEQRGVPRSGRVRRHRHRGDRREAGDAVGPELRDGVHLRRGDYLERLVPRRAHQAALAPLRVVAVTCVLVVGDGRPRLHRIAVVGRLGGAVHLEQHTADVRVAHTGGRVGVPAERCASRAAAGLVLRGVRTHGRVVGLLGLPGDDPVLDVDLPRARARAVHAVRGPHDLVVRPAVAVEHVALTAAHLVDGPVVGGDLRPPKERAGRDESVDDRVVDAGRGVHVTAPRVGVRRAPVSAPEPGAGRVGSGGRRTGRPSRRCRAGGPRPRSRARGRSR